MRQLYPTKKLVNDPQGKKILDDLKEKINASQNEIKHFKSAVIFESTAKSLIN